MGVLVVGAELEGPFGFAALAEVLGERLGDWAASLVGVGLLAAGLSSAVTAPLAAALTARGLSRGGAEPSWDHTGWRYRGVWLVVLSVGVGFGLAGAPPVPVILLAQAFNGLLLPLVAVFLFLAVNDRPRMGSRALNGRLANVLTSVVVAVSVVLGVNALARAAARALDAGPPPERLVLGIALLVLVLLAVPLGIGLRRARRP
jgi:Mn2+/Fe2+ NRAMP family transporter